MAPERIRSESGREPSGSAPAAAPRRPSMVASRRRRLSAMRRGRRRTLELLEAQRLAAEMQGDAGSGSGSDGGENTVGQQWR